MMHITLPAAGSRGDVQPFIVLGLALREAGYAVRMATPTNFKTWVLEQGFEYYPLMGDLQALLNMEAGLKWEACQGTDVIITDVRISCFAVSIVEKLHIPLIQIALQPLARTGDFPNILCPEIPHWFPGRRLYNQMSQTFIEQMIWLIYGAYINDFRENIMDLPRVGGQEYIKRIYQHPRLNCFSKYVVPRPADWSSHHHITGYLFYDPVWQPSCDLVDFIGAGTPPVYIGFGSMFGRDPERFTNIIIDALSQNQQRGVLLTGWGGIKATSVPENILVIDSASHSWLFPRMAAIVHHGGAGTTAAALRAGVPSITVPFFADQPFWGEQVARLNAGTQPIPFKRLTASRLADALKIVTTNQAMRRTAQQLKQDLSTEDGIANAVALIRKHVHL
jgi:UDP:flavonoid glycosyltransferase YjiC (YdhE family)